MEVSPRTPTASQLNPLLLRDGTQETGVDVAEDSELIELAHASLQESRPAIRLRFTLPLSSGTGS